MPPSAPPAFVTLRYKKVVGLGLAFQAINFAQGEFMGHRVRFEVPVDYMNQYFHWEREPGANRPTGRFTDAGRTLEEPEIDPLPTFAQFLEWRLGTAYTDVDGVADGLNYSSAALDTYNDSKRDIDIPNFAAVADLVDDPATATADPATHYGANDLVMAYVLAKCFGSSAFDAQEIVYNLEDAFGMLTSKALAEAVSESLEEQDALAQAVLDSDSQVGQRGKVDEMFRALLATDPQRFFLNGKQIEGLFETNYLGNEEDASGDRLGAGNWCLKVGDILEIPVKLVFTAPVTVLSVVDNVKEPSSESPAEPETVFIQGQTDASGNEWEYSAENLAAANRSNVMSVRLQLLCSAPENEAGRTFATSEVMLDDTAPKVLELKVATQMNVIFYAGPNYPPQSAIAVVPAGGNGTYTYEADTLPEGVTIDEATGVLSFSGVVDASGAPIDPLPESGRYPVTITVSSEDGEAEAVSVEANIFISIDDGTGSSNAAPATTSSEPAPPPAETPA
jgi:hypothetical protein